MDRGPRDGTPIIFFHGFQGSRLESFPGLRDVLTKLKIRLISPDRPGIGLSTPARDRTVISWASDIRQLTERLLGAGTGFSIMGFSAGATYALACGHLPGLKAVSLVSGMGLPHLIMNWRRYSQQAWRILLSAKLANLRSKTFLDIEKLHHDRVFDGWEPYYQGVRESLSEYDQEILARPEVEQLFRQNRREGYSQGPGSLLQEVQALYSDPHIDLAHLDACSVLITHGTADRVVPIGVAMDLHEQIPSSRLRELVGRGHYFMYEPVEMEQVFRELVEAHEACGRATAPAA
jgi:pimeloyl-ACP methyl ester carboxylesterase